MMRTATLLAMLSLFCPKTLAAPLPAEDQIRLAEFQRVSQNLGGSIWAGWHDAPKAILLIGEGSEHLLWHASPSEDFTRLETETAVDGDIWWRPAQYDPGLLATFPAVGGVVTIVVGTPTTTKRASTEWLITLLHEHFHQMQMSRPDYYDNVNALGLAGDDQTGMWMLNYPFPYEDQRLGRLFNKLSAVLAEALMDSKPPASALEQAEVLLRKLKELVSPADYRYLMFQFWQEGIARYVQYRALSLWRDADVSPAFAALTDYQPPSEVSAHQRRALLEELASLDLATQKRVAFYPIGASLALLLDRVQPDWKSAYFDRPFTLPGLPAPERDGLPFGGPL